MLKKSRHKKNFPVLFFLLCLPFLLVPRFALALDEDAAAALTDEQKAEKRLLFSQYVEEEKARIALTRKLQAKPQPPSQKIWIARFNAVYGVDSNVNLDSSHHHDGYFQESIDASIKWERPFFPIFGSPGKFGLTGYQEFFNYQNHTDLDYMITNVGAFTEDNITPNLSLKIPFNLIFTRYPRNDQLSYTDYQVKPTLTQAISSRLSHYVYMQFDLRPFWERKELSANGSSSAKERRDIYYEPGYGLRYVPTDKLFLGASGGWKRNDSNDIFHDFDDYTGWKANGYAYYRWLENVSWMAFGGYDKRNYDARTFSNAEAGVQTETDDLLYAGAYIFYDMTKNLQANVSYLYKQNFSNDPSREFSGYTFSGGLSLTF